MAVVTAHSLEGRRVGEVEGVLLGRAVGSAASQRAHTVVRGPQGKSIPFRTWRMLP
jgi:uncharacterized protein YbjQ (UPF0145 family)